MNQPTNASTSGSNAIADALGVITERQTYENLLYLVLAFPLGIAYYFVLVVGFTVGLALSVLVVGLGILLVTAIGLRFVASFERGLANSLLGTAIGEPDDVEKSSEGLVDTTTAYLRAPSTWRGIGFVILKFPLGILSFILLVTFLGTAVELLLLFPAPDGAFNVEVAGWEVAQSFETTAERAAAVPAGAVLALVALHLLNAFADANAAIASSLLGPERTETAQRADSDRSA